ncbi:hypothetical protein BJ165DRAFT_1504012 [Panaeolus papilionaceus]|nr:hypothetical protein BJ165DRAFT_1504012 [Panaeolus papilionaceus]
MSKAAGITKNRLSSLPNNLLTRVGLPHRPLSHLHPLNAFLKVSQHALSISNHAFHFIQEPLIAHLQGRFQASACVGMFSSEMGLGLVRRSEVGGGGGSSRYSDVGTVTTESPEWEWYDAHTDTSASGSRSVSVNGLGFGSRSASRSSLGVRGMAGSRSF